MNKKLFLILIGSLASCLSIHVPSSAASDKVIERDSAGREIIRKTVSTSYLNNVHIIVPNGTGVSAYGNTTITNSIIEARTCVEFNGMSGLRMQNNELRCGLCIKFNSDMLMDNNLQNNRCSGQGTNRPDVFGW